MLRSAPTEISILINVFNNVFNTNVFLKINNIINNIRFLGNKLQRPLHN